MEELACDFLPGADLREGTVKGSVEVDGACLLRRREQFLTFIHAGHLTSPPSRGALCLIRNLYLRVRWTGTAHGRSILPNPRPGGNSSEIPPPPSMAARFNASELLICRPQWSISRWRAKARGNPYATITFSTAAVVAATVSVRGKRAWFDGAARRLGMGRRGRGPRRVSLRQRPARAGHELSAEGSHDLATHSPAVARNTVRSLRSGRVHTQASLLRALAPASHPHGGRSGQ